MNKEDIKNAREFIEETQEGLERFKRLLKEANPDEPEDKYPGAWERHAMKELIWFGGVKGSADMRTEQNAIEAVTGSRLLQECLMDNWAAGSTIRKIMDDHYKMMKEVE